MIKEWKINKFKLKKKCPQPNPRRLFLYIAPKYGYKFGFFIATVCLSCFSDPPYLIGVFYVI